MGLNTLLSTVVNFDGGSQISVCSCDEVVEVVVYVLSGGVCRVLSSSLPLNDNVVEEVEDVRSSPSYQKYVSVNVWCF